MTMEKTYCIGDSHVCFFAGNDEYIIRNTGNGVHRVHSENDQYEVYHIGPSLAYNLCVPNATNRGREKLFFLLDNRIPAESKVLMCFGEIDCRYQILKYAEALNKSVDKTIDDCVRRYVGVIRGVRARGFDVCVWGVIPSVPDSVIEDEMYPRRGTCAERNIITRQFNHKLEDVLEDESIKFASVFDLLIDGDRTKQEFYLDDRVHLSQKIMPVATQMIERVYAGTRKRNEALVC